MVFSILKRSFSLNISKPQHKPHPDYEIDEPPFSVLRGKELYINKILSRDSSTGQSSRIYYSSTTNLGVPFQWEKKPGMPMNPPLEEVILKPTPPPLPPAVRSLVLPQPMVHMKDSSLSWRFWLWRRRVSKNTRLQMYGARRWYHMKFSSKAKGNKVSSLDSDLDADLVGWTHSDSKSSLCSSLSSSTGLSNYEQFESFRKGVPFCCTTWRSGCLDGESAMIMIKEATGVWKLCRKMRGNQRKKVSIYMPMMDLETLNVSPPSNVAQSTFVHSTTLFRR
ncbi:hypothetical protein L1887_02857 [Cichorium endivia]|nr:hypothetical protein L1887_02857 [Cichorium endivia]